MTAHRPDAGTAAASPARIDGTAVRVLVVDDEPRLTEVLCGVLVREGFDARPATDRASAVRAARQFRPDAVLLDVMLPDGDGISVLRDLRAELPRVRVLFLTARGTADDRIAGLRSGRDDYVAKPLSLEEVSTRLHGLLRTSGTDRRDANRGRLTVGDLILDEDAHAVARDGRAIDLSPTEYELLLLLMRHPRRVLSKSVILESVWSRDYGRHAQVVELYISYLRKKVDVGRAPMIHTVRGCGYVLKPAVA
jgi:two-component system OmpR family response regulator